MHDNWSKTGKIVICCLLISLLSGGRILPQISDPFVSFDSHPLVGMIAILEINDQTNLVKIEKIGTEFKKTNLPVQLDNLANVCIAEVTGDKNPDLLVKQLTVGNADYARVMYSQNLGKGKWKAFAPFVLQPFKTGIVQNSKIFPIDIAAGDINQDGKTDLIFLINDEAFQFESSIFYSLGQGKGKFSVPVLFPIQDPKARCVTIGDVTLDKRPEVILTTSEGWISADDGKKSFETSPVLKIIENKGKMQWEQPRGIIQLENFVFGFEDLAYDPVKCPDQPHLILLFKSHPTYPDQQKVTLMTLNSDQPVLKPTFIKTSITWKATGVTKNFAEYTSATPWEFFIGREMDILKYF